MTREIYIPYSCDLWGTCRRMTAVCDYVWMKVFYRQRLSGESGMQGLFLAAAGEGRFLSVTTQNKKFNLWLAGPWMW